MKKLIRLTESDLHRIVKESVKRVLNEDEKPSVNYLSNWDDEGYHYNQTIKIGLTQEDFVYDPTKLMASDYLKKPLQFGKNHLKLSQLYALAKILNWAEYKRVKMDRNTILLIVHI